MADSGGDPDGAGARWRGGSRGAGGVIERTLLRRYLATDGLIGVAPDWYPLLRAARYLGVAPWDLMQQSSLWTGWALTAERAEAEALEDKRQMDGV